jgi:hypothetical protein
MKHCPTCGSYTDDTLLYCLQDGATLQSPGAQSSPSSMAATLRDDAQKDEEATQAVNLSSVPTAQFPASALPTSLYQEARPTAPVSGSAGVAASQPANTTRVIFITAIVTVLLLLSGGIGAWMLFRGGGDGRGRERRMAQSNSDSSVGADPSNSSEGQNAAESDNRARNDNRPDKGGRWFVILASYPKDEKENALTRMDSLRKQGVDARVITSDDYPNFKSGLWLVVMGPYTRNRAEEVLSEVRPKVSDAYTKSGW